VLQLAPHVEFDFLSTLFLDDTIPVQSGTVHNNRPGFDEQRVELILSTPLLEGNPQP
jgi:hypothetical protein